MGGVPDAMNAITRTSRTWKKIRAAGACMLLVSFVGTLFPHDVFAATGAPRILNYQGRLMDSNGTLLGGSGTEYCFKFSLYDTQTIGGGTKLWPSGSPSTMTASVRNGAFSVGVGDTNAGGDVLDYNFQDTDTVYLNIEVATKVGATCATGDGAETFETLAPRQRIYSAAYALNSNTVGGYTPSQEATGNQIPVLTNGRLILGGANPFLNATGTSALTFQGGGEATGDIQFFNSANRIDSLGNLTLGGEMFASAFKGLTTLSVGTTATSTLQADVTGTSTIQGFINVLGTNSTSTFSGGIAASYLDLTGTTATSTAANGLNLTGGCFAINGSCIETTSLADANSWSALQTFENGFIAQASSTVAAALTVTGGLTVAGGLVADNATTTNATSTNLFASAFNATHATSTNLFASALTAGGATSSAFYVSGSFRGAGLGACTNPTDKLQWDETTGQFVCGTDSGTFSTTSTDYWFAQQDTDDLAEGSNLYFTSDRVAGVLAATNTDALDEGLSNLYWTQDRFNTALLATSSLPHLSVGTSSVALTALSLSGFDPSIYMTNAAWYATTTDALDEGSANFYYTDDRVNSFLAASTSVVKTFAGNTFSGANIFNGATTLTNATATTFRTGTLGVGSDYITDITGNGLFVSGGALTLDMTADWTGTLDGYDASQLLAAAFSTTSADFWKTQSDFFSTTSAAYYLSQNQGLAFSTTSATHFLSQNQGLAFSTTSADAWDASKNRWSTTSSNFWKSVTDFFSTTSSDHWLTTKDTDDLAEGLGHLYYTSERVAGVIAGTTTDALAEGNSNLYFTDERADARVAAGIAATNTDALDEGLSNLYWTQDRFNTALLATSSLPHMSVGTATVALSLSGFDPSIYMTNAAWYATTTDALDEGTTNFYYTDDRVNSFLAASTSVVKTFADNTFSGANIFSGASTFNGATTLTNATATTFRTGTLGVGSDYITDITGTGLLNVGGALSVDLNADWTGTLDGYDASQLLAAAFSTTSADYWKTQNNFFSTTSADYWKSITNFFSTTSADSWLTTKDTDDLAEGSSLFFTSERVAGVIAGTSTDALAEGNNNLYFTDERADARVAAGIAATNTDALDEGLSNLYWTQDRFNSALLATSSLPHMSVGTATVALSLSGFNANNYLTTAAWYATTTDGLDEGSSNLYFTNDRVNSFLAASTSVVKTFADNTFSGANIFNGATTLTNATATTFRTNTLGVGSDYITDITGTGLLNVGGALSVDLSADWTGTLDGYEAADLLANAFSTTSADYWKTQNNFFSTTSTDYWKSITNFFSTTSADSWLTTKDTDDLAEGSNLFFTSDRVAGVIAGTSTDALEEGNSNLYFTNERADARVAAGIAATNTDALDEGLTNLYWTQDRFNTALLATSSLPHLSVGTSTVALTALSLSGFDPSIYMTNAAWYATTTDGLDEGTINLYFTNDRVNSFLAASTSVAKTFANNTFSGANIFNGATTLTNATSTTFRTSTLGVGSDYITDLTGTGLLNSGGALSVDLSANWTGTLDGYEAADLLANAFSTTSADYWKTRNDFFSTTSVDYWKSITNFFSTTSSDHWLTTKDSDDLAEGSGNLFFTSERVAGVIAGTSTDALAEGNNNLYFTNERADARVAAGIAATNTDALDEGLTNLYWTQDRFNTALLATSSLPHLSVGTSTVALTALSLSGFDPSIYMTNAAWYATTTDGLDEGTNNLYFTNDRVNSFLAASTSVVKTFADNTFSGANIFNGATTLTNATATTFRTGTLGVGSDYLTDITGTGLLNTGGALSVDLNADWTGTLDGYDASQLLAAAFSTTSADYWKTQNNFFSTTSADYWKSITNFFSTTSADSWLTTKDTDDLAEGSNLFFTSDRVAGVIAGTTTDALDEGTNNLYFTNERADARVAAGIAATNTDALDEGLSNLYWTQNRFDAALLATSSLPHMSVGTSTVALTALSLSGFDPSIYMTNAAWYATTTDGLDEGTNNLYFTNDRVNSFLAASTSVVKTFADNTFSGANIFNGATTLTNATATTFRTNTLGVGSDYITDLTGTGLLNTGGALSVDLSADWTGTLDGYEAADLLANAFSTTSADFWKTQNNFFSTTSADYWKSITNFFSTTSADSWLTTKDTDDLAEGSNLFFTSERVAGVIAGTTTDALDEGTNNLYFTNERADARVAAGIAGTTTDALDEGLSNLYWTQNRFDAALLATSSLPHMSVGTATVALSLSGFDPSIYMTNAAWYATTTDGLDEGSSNLYFTNDRVNSFLAASTSVVKTFADNTFSGANIFNGATTLTNATATTFRTNTLGVGSDYITDLTGTGLLNTGGALSVDLSADWTGTLDGYDASQLLAAAFSTTSADYWKTQNNFFSTTSADYWKSITNFFSTTSADSWLTTKDTDDLAEGSNLFFTNERVAGVIAGTTTDALAEGNNNLYFTNERADARVAAGIAATNTDALDEGLSNLYWTQNRFDAALLATSSLPHLSVGTSTVALTALSLSGFDPSIYMTNAAWYATTTDGLDEGSSNLYFTNDRVNSFLAASTSVVKTFADNTFSGANIFSGASTFNGATTLTNATATTFRTGTLGVGSDYITDITGTGLLNTGGALSVDLNADWTGTLDGYEAADLLANAFSTTSADFWKTQNNFFSTTSADYWKSITNFFSTTSADSWLTTKDTDDLAEGSNLFFTSDRVAGVIAGTSTDALEEGNSNLYFTNDRVNDFLAASTSVAKTFANNTFAGTNTFTGGTIFGNTTSTNATSTTFRTGTLGVGSDSITDITGSGLLVSGGALTVDGTTLTNVDAATLDSLDSTAFLRSDVDDSAAGLITLNGGFLATASSTINGNATTTGMMGVGSLFMNSERFTDLTGTGLQNVGGVLTIATSTFSGSGSGFDADFLDGLTATYFINNSFSSTSANLWKSQNNFFSTTSSDMWLTTKTTDDLTEGSTNLYYNDSYVDARITASTTIPKTYTDNTFTGNNTFVNATATTFRTGTLGVGNDYLTDITGTGLILSGGALTVDGSVVTNVDANTIDGLDSTAFLRTDTASAASQLITFSAGFLSSASSTINANLTVTGDATTTGTQRVGTLAVGSDALTDLTGTGLQNVGGVLTLDRTLDWTGTLDGYEAADLLGAAFSTTSADVWLANRSIEDVQDVAAMTKSYGNLLSWDGSTWTNRATSTLGVALSDTTGTLQVDRGGTGAASFGQGWIYSDGGTGALAASTSPTVNYVTATSTTASSTFPRLDITTAFRMGNDYITDITGSGLQITSGALSVATATFSGTGSLFNADLLDGQDGLYYIANGFSTTSAQLFVHSSSTIPTTYKANTFTGENTFTGGTIFGNTTSTNATSTNMYVSGILSLGNALGQLFGGTGQSSYNAGDILYADGSGILTKLGVGSPGEVLKVSAGNLPQWGADDTSGGSGGFWATTTDNLAVHPSDTSDVVIIGAAGTTTTGNVLEVTGNALFRNVLTAYDVMTAPIFTATSTTATSTFPRIDISTAFRLGTDYITDITGSGLQLSGSSLTLDTSGSWTGTLDGIDSGSFLRSDAADSASSLITFNQGLIAQASSTVTGGLTVTGGAVFDRATTTNATTTTFAITALSNNMLKVNANGSVVAAQAGTDFLASAITAIGPTGQTQTGSTITLATTTSGTNDFTITASGNTVTFNMPSASSANRGLLTNTDWTLFNNKISSTSIDTSLELSTLLTDETGGGGYLVFSNNPLLTGFISNASSTIGNGTQQGGLTVAGGATTTGFLTVQGTATSTFAGGIQTTALNVTSGTASSTFANGINLTTGCFAINGTCIGMSSGGPVDGTGVAGALAFWVDNNSLTNDTNFVWNSATERLGIGTSTPFAKLSISANVGDTNTTLFTIASTTGGTATSTLLTVLNNGNMGLGTSSPFAKLAVIGGGNGSILPSLVIATTSDWGAQGNQQPLLYVTSTTTGALDYARVAIGTTTTWGSASGLRDQFTVAGRIYQTWAYLACEVGGASQLTANITADATSACGNFAFDAVTDGQLISTDGYPAFTRLRAGVTTSFATTEGAYVRTKNLIAPATSSPVMEARVRLPNATSALTRQFTVGFTNTASGAASSAPTNGVYFAASSTPNWIAIMRRNNVETRVNTGIATSTNFLRMRIELSSSTATYLINGNIVASISPSSMTSANLAPVIAVTNPNAAAGTAAINDIDISYIRVWIDDPVDGVSSPILTGVEDVFDPIEGADIAESYLADAPPELYLPGMLVSNSSSSPGMIRRSLGRYDADVFGAITTSPHTVLGMESSTTVRVGMVGRVPVIVSLENGPIHAGDRIAASSVMGVGMKASRASHTVGKAFESFDPVEGVICDTQLAQELTDAGVTLPENICLSRVMVVLQPGFDMSIGNIIQDPGEAVQTLADAMKELTNDAFTQGAELVKLVIGKVVAKVAIIETLFTKTMYAEDAHIDDVSAKKLCLGDVCITKDQLIEMLSKTGQESAALPVDETATTTTATSTDAVATTSPVITINGMNPAHIPLHSTYNDLGAIVTDDHDTNLGIHTFINDIEVPSISLDTGTTTTYTITYRATDTDGNIGEATRTVIIDPPAEPATPPAEELPAPETPATQEPPAPDTSTTTPESTPTPETPTDTSTTTPEV